MQTAVAHLHTFNRFEMKPKAQIRKLPEISDSDISF